MTRTSVFSLWLAVISGSAWAQSVETGKRLFLARCATCHGEDGTGGARGATDITDPPRPRARSREALRDLIRDGVPDVGMPPFQLSDEELDAVAGYVVGLRASAAARRASGSVPGDAAAGERFFAQKDCFRCHRVQGRGGLLGPDLSTVGRERSPAQIEQALRDPGSAAPAPGPRGSRGGEATYPAATVRLRDGRTVRGIAKNESPFDLQLLDVEGRLHLLSKDQVSQVVRERSLMPRVEASATELRDLVAYLKGLTRDWEAKAPVSASTDRGPGVPFADVAHPKPGVWPTYHGSVSGNRFSALDQINASNVARLAPRWMFTLSGSPRPLQGTPLVVDGILYMTAVNEAYALDARSGREIWHYSRPRTKGLAGDAASGINRGVAVLGERVFMVTDNAHLIALDRATGRLLWDAEMADSRQNYGATGAPLVVDDLVISGVSGGDEGIRGFLDAYRAATGERVWRFWTVPLPGQPGSETWIGKASEHGCAATWLTGTYDPEAKFLYWPTGNPCPDYNGDERKGDNLYSCSVIALEPATGKLKWHFQFTPHDLHDWDAQATPMLVDAQFRGSPRKLLLHANRNGFFYVLDRLTGKFLLAAPFVKNLTWASGVDANGRPQLLADAEPNAQGRKVCPAVAGAANWPSTAYSPRTGLFYMFAEESCSIYSKKDEEWEAGKSFYGGGTRRSAPDGGGGKFLKALDLQTGKVVWEIPDPSGGILQSGLMATAGDLVFYGDSSGAFVAASARDGKLLWHFNTGQSWKAGPMTYTVDGNQYVAIAAGSTVIAFGLR
jgi:alcohol dehydrogenase (cytochrome c)